MAVNVELQDRITVKVLSEDAIKTVMIVGKEGPPGPVGPAGTSGQNGEQGIQGIQGEQGIQGIQGEPGVGVPEGGLTGQVLGKATSADYDFAWVDGGIGGGGGSIFRGCRVYNNAGGTQSIPASTYTKVVFNATSFDTDSFYNASTDRIVIPAGLEYVNLTATVVFAGSSTATDSLRLIQIVQVRTSEMIVAVASVSASNSQNDHVSVCSGPISVVAGDYFELRVYQTDAAGVNVLRSSTYISMEVLPNGTSGTFARMARVYKSGTNQSIASQSWTKVSLQSIVLNDNSMWDAGLQRFVIPVGIDRVQFNLGVRWIGTGETGGNNNTYRLLGLYKNGAATLFSQSSTFNTSDGMYMAFSSGPLQVAAGDYFEFYVFNRDSIAHSITAGVSTYAAMTVLSGSSGVDTIGVPLGAIMAFPFDTPPTGFLECDGSAVGRNTYAALFDKISP